MLIGCYIMYLLVAFIFGMHPSWYYMQGAFFSLLLVVVSLVLIPSLFLAHLFWHQDEVRQTTRSGWGTVFILFVLTLGLFFSRLPMRIGFLVAKAKLESALVEREGSFQELNKDIDTLLYDISAKRTNSRLAGGRNPGRMLFMFKDDGESAFIYSQHGIENLSYNSGECGHLMGDWYWMKED